MLNDLFKSITESAENAPGTRLALAAIAVYNLGVFILLISVIFCK